MNWPTIAPRASAIPTLPAQAAAIHTASQKYRCPWQRARTRALLYNASRSVLRVCAQPVLKWFQRQLIVYEKKTIFKKVDFRNYILVRIAQKGLFIITFFCFVAFATNILLAVHIICEHNCEEHSHSSSESSDCSVCQKLITSLASFTIDKQILFVDIPTEQHLVLIRQNTSFLDFHPEAISPRGPPA